MPKHTDQVAMIRHVKSQSIPHGGHDQFVQRPYPQIQEGLVWFPYITNVFHKLKSLFFFPKFLELQTTSASVFEVVFLLQAACAKVAGVWNHGHFTTGDLINNH